MKIPDAVKAAARVLDDSGDIRGWVLMVGGDTFERNPHSPLGERYGVWIGGAVEGDFYCGATLAMAIEKAEAAS